MTDHDTLERIARQLAADRGCDYDRKGAKRAHWRAKARRFLSIRDTADWPDLVTAIMRAAGWLV